MAQARKKSSRRGGRKKPRGWLLVLIGLGIGVAGFYLAQLLVERNLHHVVRGWFKRERSVETVKQQPEKPKSKFDFYTILPETDTRPPDRGRTEPKAVKTEKPKPEEPVVYILQAGSFETVEKADQLKAELALQGLQAYIQKVSVEGKGERHRVLLGPYHSADERDTAIQQLGKVGIKPLKLTGKKNA